VPRLLLALLSSGLLLASFPPHRFGWCAWFALAPLLCALAGTRPWRGFLLAYLSGAGFFAFLFDWLFEVKGFTVFHDLLLSAFFGLLFALFGLLFTFVWSRLGPAAACAAAPFVWIALEYAKSNIPDIPSPYPLLGYSQHAFLPAIQIAAVTGPYGVSFLVMAVNAALALMALRLARRRAGRRAFASGPGRGERGSAVVVGAVLLLAAVSLGYGLVVCATPIEGNRVKVSLVQANIAQSNKWDPESAASIMAVYGQLTAEAALQRPDLIVWPEAATPHPIPQTMETYRVVRSIVKQAGTDLLLGSSSTPKLRGQQRPDVLRSMNSAFLIQNGVLKPQRYDKIILFPFGEFLPLRGKVPWSRINVPDRNGYLAGEKPGVFKLATSRFGVAICWESGFPQLVRAAVAAGAQFMVNIANDAWFGTGAASHQFVSYNVFRAVENRRFVVRCANTGVSCIIDPRGRILERLTDQAGNDLFVRGVLSGTVVPIDSLTIYTRYGDWIVWLACLVTAAVLGMAVLTRARRAEVSAGKN